jgi:hypothetical protein
MLKQLALQQELEFLQSLQQLVQVSQRQRELEGELVQRQPVLGQMSWHYLR